MLTRDDILGALALKTETVDVPEWGGQVTITELPAVARFSIQEDLKGIHGLAATDAEKNARAMAALVVRCVVGPDGALLLRQEDTPALIGKHLDALGTIYAAAARLNGFIAPEETAKNSEPGQADLSDSPSA